MEIKQINIYHVHLPFRSDFSISQRSGLSSETIILELVTEKNIIGYGEGIPIEIVTGETPAKTMKDVEEYARKDDFPRKLNTIDQLKRYIEQFPGTKEHNAAICAIETALLDALGKSENKYVLDYFPKDYLANEISYSGFVTLGDKARVKEVCAMVKKFGINKIRVKLGKNFEQNKGAIETVAEIFGAEADLRIDPNGVWDSELAFRHLPLIKNYRVKIVEEPMPKTAPGFPEFAQAVKDAGAILMACESAPTLNDIEIIIREGYYGIINVKLCRSGGFFRALKMIERIRQSGLAFQIGCTLGESSILSAAGRILGLLNKDAVYYDGSYDDFLFKDNFIVPGVSFGPGGRAKPLLGPGFGVLIDRAKLQKMSLAQKNIIL